MKTEDTIIGLSCLILASCCTLEPEVSPPTWMPGMSAPELNRFCSHCEGQAHTMMVDLRKRLDAAYQSGSPSCRESLIREGPRIWNGAMDAYARVRINIPYSDKVAALQGAQQAVEGVSSLCLSK